ncbi:MAG: hypothetical protein WC059_00055 [Candidatus Paceibacterota bacterium]
MSTIIKDPKQIANEIALAGLQIGAIKINFEEPFLWASGTYNPFYNDNRMFLKDPEHRKLIIEGFLVKLTSLGFEPKNLKDKIYCRHRNSRYSSSNAPRRYPWIGIDIYP